MMKRHIVRIAVAPETPEYYGSLYALCTDGTLWRAGLVPESSDDWQLLPPIPPAGDGE